MNAFEQREYYERRYENSFESRLRDGYKFYDACFRFADARYDPVSGRGARALDVGCGSGGVLWLLRERGYDVHGLDFSERAVAEIRRRNLGIVKTADIQQGIPFTGTFDLIVCFEVLEHLYEPIRALQHMRDKLAQGGVLIATTPYPGTATDPSDVSIKLPEQWINLMKEAGFGYVKAQPVRYLPYVWRLHRRLGQLFPVPARLSTTVLFVAR